MLFVGGPFDGEVRNVGTTQEVHVMEPQTFDLYTFGQMSPVRSHVTNRMHSYYRASVALDGKVYAVMRHLGTPTSRLEDAVQTEVHNRLWNSIHTTSFPQRWVTGIVFDEAFLYDTRTDEEKCAWMFEGEGKDFL